MKRPNKAGLDNLLLRVTLVLVAVVFVVPQARDIISAISAAHALVPQQARAAVIVVQRWVSNRRVTATRLVSLRLKLDSLSRAPAKRSVR